MEFVGESSLDEADASFERRVLRCKQEMYVVRHDDEGVEFVTALVTIALKRGDEEFGVCGCLKEYAAIVGCGGDEVRAGTLLWAGTDMVAMVRRGGGERCDGCHCERRAKGGESLLAVAAVTSGAEAPFYWVAGMACLKPCP
jgi:hypothetical protein